MRVHVVYLTEDSSSAGIGALPGRMSGKFVQIRHADGEYLVFAPKEIALYHADIVERFCRERGIAGSVSGSGKIYEVLDPDWTVVGGGKFEIDGEKKRLRLYDNSMAYGRFDSRGMKEKIHLIAGLSDFTVEIE